jgi:hypothetical protein
MLSRGFRTSKKQKIWAAALNTQSTYVWEWVDLWSTVSTPLSSQFVVLCRVVPVLWQCSWKERYPHMFIVHFCQTWHLRSDNDWFWLSDRSVVVNRGTFELLIILKSQWSWTVTEPWHMCFCYMNYVILFNKNHFYRAIGLVLDSIHRLVCGKQNTTTFRRLDLSPSSGGWGRINPLERASLNHWIETSFV